MEELFGVVRGSLVVANKHKFAELVSEATDSKLIRLSIQKWEFLRAKVAEENRYIFTGGTSTCALCWGHDGCRQCPIGRRTGKIGCGDTPNIDYERLPNKVASKALYIIDQELEYLNKLLEEVLEEEKHD